MKNQRNTPTRLTDEHQHRSFRRSVDVDVDRLSLSPSPHCCSPLSLDLLNQTRSAAARFLLCHLFTAKE
ncbi:hypothetical protein RHGRI_001697 [Rhododendron griersonianum]|uniref:Uncharacterized protein n=1 Tax=Rhododendron griersonianum TaxID=479676 RepID=A0AAV6LPB8_9ERIC|nr:hypothetical protein RHGRI_001697 [Rhododendron griersonianum]